MPAKVREVQPAAARHYFTGFNPNQIHNGLRRTFPELPTFDNPKLLADGFSSYAILAAGEFIFRIAKTSEAMNGYQKERMILPRLRPYLPVQIPEPLWYAGPSELFPFGVMGYRLISGIPFSLDLIPQVNLSRIAQDLAQILAALHQVSPEQVANFGLDKTSDDQVWWQDVASTLRTHLPKGEYEMIISWWDAYLNSPAGKFFTPKLIHGDPWGENIILNETLDRVVGIVDFESVTVGDVAQDFAAQKYVGLDFMSQVIESYEKLGGDVEGHFDRRLRDVSMLRELRGLWYAVKYPEAGELKDSLQKVRAELVEER